MIEVTQGDIWWAVIDAMGSDDVRSRLDGRIHAWRVVVEHIAETENSLLAFGTTDRRGVVLKIVKQPGDEWRSGDVLRAFGGRGVVRVLEHVDGALLMERLTPGTPLAHMSLEGRDGEATDVLAGVIGSMSPDGLPAGVPSVADWAVSFEKYDASGGGAIPERLVSDAHRVYRGLCESQSRTRLLHGDLHHGNVLFDAERGWLAIDPKGVVGEPEYEVGAMLRNPVGSPEIFLPPAMFDARVCRLAARLSLDTDRIIAWAFAQAVLSAIWAIEDGEVVDATAPALTLAQSIRHRHRASWALA